MIRARAEARKLRQQGLSINEIVRLTGASKSSVSVWVRDIELTEEQKAVLKENQRQWAGQNAGAQVNRRKSQELRRKYQEAGRATAKEMRPLHLTGCMLYWAEGAKDQNKLYFVNSDPNMMKLFMRFLREEMEIVDSSVVVYIHVHTIEPNEIHRIEHYWLDLLKLPESSLRKTLFKKGSEIRHKVLANGVCTVRVYSVELVHHIYGAIQEYGGFENPDWLF